MAVYYGNNDWRDYHLEHYGIKGMRWGVRRFQNPDGSVTPAGKIRYNEGRKAYKSERKKDNQIAKALGEQATIARLRSDYIGKKAVKAKKAYEKDVSNNKKKEKYIATLAAYIRATDITATHVQSVVQHHKHLIEKYGEINVSDIKRDKKGRINEVRPLIERILGPTPTEKDLAKITGNALIKHYRRKD